MAIVFLFAGCTGAPEPRASVEAPLAAATGPQMLVTGMLFPLDLRIDATSLYWISHGNDFGTGGEVARAPLAGGAATHLVSSHAGEHLELDGTTLFWLGDNYLGKTETDGTGKKLLVAFADGGGNTTDMVEIDATWVYYTTATEIWKVPRAGGTPVLVASGLAVPADVASDGDQLYFTEFGTVLPYDVYDGTVARVAKTGGPVERLATGQHHPTKLVVDATDVYYTTVGRYAGGTTGYVDGRLKRVPKAGGDAVVLAEARSAGDLLLAGGYLWFTEPGERRIKRMRLGATSPTIVVSNEPGYPSSLAVDGSWVYWTLPRRDPRSQIRRLALADIAPSRCDDTPVALASSGAPVGVSATGTWVYWSDVEGGAIRRTWRNGGVTELVAGDRNLPGTVFADPWGVFWTEVNRDTGATEIWMRSDKTGEPIALRVAPAVEPELVADRKFLYFTDGTPATGFGIYRVGRDDGTAPRRIVSSPEAPQALTHDGTDLWFITDGGFGVVLYRVAESGGTPIPVKSFSNDSAGPIAVDDANVYIATRNRSPGGSSLITAVAKADATTRLLYAGDAVVRDLQVDRDQIVFTDQATGDVLSLRVTGESNGVATHLAEGAGSATELDAEGGCVAWAGDGTDGPGIYKVALADVSEPPPAACEEPLVAAKGFSANRDWVFWSEEIGGPGIDRKDLHSVPRIGGSVRLLASVDQPESASPIADELGVYFGAADNQGHITFRYYTSDGVLRGGPVRVGRALAKQHQAYLYWIDYEQVFTEPYILKRLGREEIAAGADASDAQTVVATDDAIGDYDFGVTYVYYGGALADGSGRGILKVAKTGGEPHLLYDSEGASIRDSVVVHGWVWLIRGQPGVIDESGWADIFRVNAATGEVEPVLRLDNGQYARLAPGSDTAYLTRRVDQSRVDVYRLDAAAGTATVVPYLRGVEQFQIDDAGAVYQRSGVVYARPSSCGL